TNKIYVINQGDQFSNHPGNITVIDGATNTILTTITGPDVAQPGFAAAVNPVTNKIYVINGFSNITVIDGATNSTTTIADPTPGGPFFVAVDQETNKIYVTHVGIAIGDVGGLTVIDGLTNTATTIQDPHAANPLKAAVNPVTNQVYVANLGNYKDGGPN